MAVDYSTTKSVDFLWKYVPQLPQLVGPHEEFNFNF